MIWEANSEMPIKIDDENQLASFLDELEGRLEEVDIEYGETLWKKYLREPHGNLDEIERKRSKIILNDHYLRVVKEWVPRVKDGFLAKRVRAVERLLLSERIEALPDIFALRNRINEEHIKFRPVVLGKEMDRTDVREMLRKDPDRSKRKAAWESSAELSRKIENDVKELMKKRNYYAKELGYETYVEYSLSLDMIDKTELLNLYEELDRLSKPSFRATLEEIKEKLNIEHLEPWDISFAIDQFVKPPDEHFPKDHIIPKIKELVKSWGISTEKLPILIKQADIPFGGLCFAIHIPKDVRIVSNPRDGHKFYATLFHEYGHALHACFVKQRHYALKLDVGCFNEGMATILQHFTSDPEWLRVNTSLSNEEIARFVKARKASLLLRLRSLMALSIFEFLAYENPDRDLNKLWSRTRSRYLFVSENETPQWAAQSIYTTHPIYFQNYILAEMIAAQTIQHLKETYGELLNNAQIAEFLIQNYYSPGSSIDWPEKVRRATGKRLSAKALVEQLAI
jgi:peptidyl-dipeptidase A